MIISHKHKFIFLKTRKTAGTSIEIALSQFCGPDDIITAIEPKDEALRQELGFPGPQNNNIPWKHYNLSTWVSLLKKRRFTKLKSHIYAGWARDIVGENLWNSYFKFSFERNPFDKAISRYYWSTRDIDSPPAISDYLESAPTHYISNWSIYTIDNKIAVDFVGSYERLSQDLSTITEKIGLPGELNLPRAKGGYRKDKRHYSEVLDQRSRAIVEKICANEIATFGYQFEYK